MERVLAKIEFTIQKNDPSMRKDMIVKILFENTDDAVRPFDTKYANIQHVLVEAMPLGWEIVGVTYVAVYDPDVYDDNEADIVLYPSIKIVKQIELSS